MLNTKLSPCANLLYHWLLIHQDNTQNINFDLKSFQIWTGEFLDKNASESEILEAMYLLKNLGLIFVDGQSLKINQQCKLINTYTYELPKFYLLGEKTNKRSTYFWGLFMLISFMILWGGSFWFSIRLAQLSPKNMTPLTPYSILSETDKK